MSDTALENLLSRTDYRAKNLSYTQNYRPEDSSYSTVANLTRAEVTAATGEESTSNTMSLGGNTSFGEGHALSLNGYFANSESTGQSKASNLDAVLAHDFSLEYYYRVSNNLRFSDSSSRLGPLGQSIERRDVQAQNNVFWLPSDDYPLTLNSSISLSRSGAGSDASTGVTGLLSANYVFSPKLSATSAVSGGQSSAGVTRSRFVAFDTSASYSGDARTLGAFNHGWGAGAGIGATRSTGGSSRSMTVSVSQSLDRGFTLDERSSVNLAFSESASIGRATTTAQGASVDSDSSNLSHLANLNYFRSEEGASFSAGITAQDSRTFAKSDGSYAQSIGASGNGQFFIDRLSSMSASIGWGFSRTHSNPSWTQYGSGSASYLRSRPFGLRAAAYSARLQLNIRRDARQPGQVVDNRGLEEPYLYNYSVEHGLDARVGLLSSRLSNSFAWDEGGQLTWGVNFRVTRQF